MKGRNPVPDVQAMVRAVVDDVAFANTPPNSTKARRALDSSPFPPIVKLRDSGVHATPACSIGDIEGGSLLANETERTRLIGELSRLIREPLIPESMRSAGLTLIGWLARRMPGEPAHALGVPEAQRSERDSERRMRAAVRKAAR
jgi:hypothetical protein